MLLYYILIIILMIAVLSAPILIFQRTRTKTPERPFTFKELSEYTEKPIFVSLKGIVYDVSRDALFQPGGEYHMFAGHDATVCMAKGVTDKKLLNSDWNKLNKKERKFLKLFERKFEAEYEKVGWVENL